MTKAPGVVRAHRQVLDEEVQCLGLKPLRLCLQSLKHSVIGPPVFSMHKFGRCFTSIAVKTDEIPVDWDTRGLSAKVMALPVDSSSWIEIADRSGVHERWLPIAPLNWVSPLEADHEGRQPWRMCFVTINRSVSDKPERLYLVHDPLGSLLPDILLGQLSLATSPRGNNNQVLLDIPNPSNHLVHHVQADLVCIMLVADRHLKCEEDGGDS